MKLNYKRTLLVGFAFFLICVFWQAYDATIPLILTNKFGMSQTWSGVIMAIDNILALFMLPLFGTLSDKVNTPYGKRTPFIVLGTIVACVAFVSLSFVDNAQAGKIDAISKIDDKQCLQTIYDRQKDATLVDTDGNKYVLGEKFTAEEFSAITCKIDGENGKKITNPDYINYVTPARQACASQITAQDPSCLIFFIALLLIVLISMATFRSPAVALMPDVTIKPLRSKANAIINLMGTAGGIVVLVLGIIFATSSVENGYMSYTGYNFVVAGIMLIALGLFVVFVKEKQWAREMQADSLRFGVEEIVEDTSEKKGLDKGQKKSLLFLLASIVLWFFGYNAITSKYAVYAANILDMDYNLTLIIAQAGAIVAYLPVGMIASRIGRKKTILAGVALLGTTFFIASFMRIGSSPLVMNLLFALAGIAWATINVNSFPMVVEMCSGSDIGKYTGFYYTASMAAQTATPMISGWFMDTTGTMTVLFPYATVFVTLAFVTMLFVKHGDNKVEAKRGLEAFDTDD